MIKHALLASLLLLPLTAVEAHAVTAGVTAAVNQNAKSIPPGGAIRTIVLGDNVVQDETIETDAAGLVQILLADGTTFTVGPNSSLVIDRFVYDPNANTAQVAASLGRGVFRFIGGRTSKTDGGVQLNTPVGTVGIRGGMADLNFTGTGGNIAQIDLLFGNEVTLNGPNGGDRLFQAGYSIVIGPNGQPTVVKTPPGSANFIQQALAGRPGANGGNPDQPDDDDVENSGVADTNSNDTPPADIPPPDLNAIDLATPKPTDINQVAQTLYEGEQAAPGKKGFSAGIFYFDYAEDSVMGAPAHDFDGDTRVLFDASGNPIGGRLVIGLEGAQDFEDTLYEVKAINRIGNYPGATSTTLTLGGTEVQTINGGQSTITSSADLDEEEWPDTELVNCECIEWGTWSTAFGTLGNGLANAGYVGTWIVGDIVTSDEYDSLATQDPYGSLFYVGTAAGYGQYMVDGEVGDIFAATGDIEVTWNLASSTGTFSLDNFGGGLGSQSEDLAHSFTSSATIGRGDMAKGLFGGNSSDPNSFLSVTGAFINDGNSIGEAVVGSFSGAEVFTTEGDQDVVFSGAGVFAGDRDYPH